MNEVLAADMLRTFIDRIERLGDEIGDLQADRRDVFKEAKAHGYDPAIMRVVLRRRKMEPHQLDELDALTEVYEAAVGRTRGFRDCGELERVGDALALPSPPLTNSKLGKAEAGVAAWLDGGEDGAA